MSSELSEAVARSVRSHRAAERLTQAQLGEAVGLSRAQVVDLESGKRGVSLDDAEALCRGLSISLDELLGRTPRGREAAETLGLESA